ncbi:GGDEF domain-containing protein [Stenotrophomonas sp. S41]|uniref:GGDEF domain-containing protein n=1 Tax=Stenotrophomonas sp. S41 TaxID=2767464 RepID=UPI00190E406E|nr:GGDEF domain-containing protein [Stenotrophomonas sp. S41]MBK0012955.1 GGDEF domain-containing protein [Stenotrophomonas sp. S41]
MKAGWLNEFSLELMDLKNSSADIKEVTVFHSRADEWYVGDNLSACHDDFSVAVRDGKYRKLGLSKTYAFPLNDAGVVVCVEFSIFPKTVKLNLISSRIEQVRENSRHRFDALHDSLTGCKNRKSFETDLSKALEILSSSGGTGGGLLAHGGLNSVSLATLDIDFFKRINDSRGHDYGDLVLRSFAWLVQDQCSLIQGKRPKLRVDLYRLGGEEFNILFSGEVEEREVLDVLEELRSAIEREVIPSDSQLAVIGGDGVVVPPPSERHVTASFGLARLTGITPKQNPSSVAGRLKVHSDKALYSAKGAGRNCIRYFPDILKKYGRVLEHDSSAGVVVIDIGLEAGVVKGREFFVVPERYTGERNYIVDDGRTRRILGRYPRIKTAKIVAFDVQSEISFCSISERREGIDVVEGDFLESIPLGLFGGLSGLHGHNEISREIEAEAVLRSWLTGDPGDSRRVLSIRFADIREVERSHGSVKANEILAGAVAAAKRVFPAPMRIVQTEIGQFGVALSCDEDSVDELMERMIRLLYEICSDVADFSLGLFDRDSMTIGLEAGYSLDLGAAYDYATIAAASVDKNAWRRFDARAPQDVISQNYYSNEYEKVLADYDRFKELGIVGSMFENFAGLSHFVFSGDAELAGVSFRAAVEYQDSPVVRSNLAIAQFYCGRFADAYDNLNMAMAANAGEHPNENSSNIFAVAGLESHLLRGDPDLVRVSELFNVAEGSGNLSFLKPGQFEAARSKLDDLRAV